MAVLHSSAIAKNPFRVPPQVYRCFGRASARGHIRLRYRANTAGGDPDGERNAAAAGASIGPAGSGEISLENACDGDGVLDWRAAE